MRMIVVLRNLGILLLLAIAVLLFRQFRGPGPTIDLEPPLWGFADLHTHPASHVSFGADSNGNGGIFWGKPGSVLGSAASPLSSDLPSCASDSHSGFDADAVRTGTRREIIKTIDDITGHSHGPGGDPAFVNWPHALSLNHQQMHITAIRRAYDGGLRLMIADATDHQMLSALWNKITYTWAGGVPQPEATYEFESAKRQLLFIQTLALQNSGWMQIVRSAAEARQAIAANKLAVVLGIEMDSISPDQILELVRTHGVRHVIPIHLANNEFGGAAIYSDPFNVANRWLTGSFFSVESDPNLTFELGRPQELKAVTGPERGAVAPQPIGDAEYQALAYPGGPAGHRNQMGLKPNSNIEKLMRAGVLLDVAHMGDKSTGETLALADRYQYPVMDSHTGLRGPNEKGPTERFLKHLYAGWIGRLGGVIGHGTEATIPELELLDHQSPMIRFAGGQGFHHWPLFPAPSDTRVLHSLHMTFKTGGTSLLGGSTNADVRVYMRNNQQHAFLNVNQSGGWPADSKRSIHIILPAGTRVGDIIGVSLSGDKWDIESVRIAAVEAAAADTVGRLLDEMRQAMTVAGGPVALGTDINGFAPQIPFATDPVAYPVNVASRFGVRPTGYVPPDLARSSMGAKTYDFQKDGIANFGMLPELLEAMSQKPDSFRVVDGLYRSADAVVKMWEKTEAASRNVPPEP